MCHASIAITKGIYGLLVAGHKRGAAEAMSILFELGRPKHYVFLALDTERGTPRDLVTTIPELDPCNDPVTNPAPDRCFDVPIAPGQGQGPAPAPLPGPFASRSVAPVGAGQRVRELHTAATDPLGTDSGVVLVIFKNASCPPCSRLLGIMDDLAPDYQDEVTFYSVDVQQDRQLASRHGIEYTPTMILFANGVPVGKGERRRWGAGCWSASMTCRVSWWSSSTSWRSWRALSNQPL